MRLNENHWLLTRPVTHRGLWRGNAPENSLPAFRNAIDASLPIETDVQMTADGVLVCFHDDDLKRATGVSGDVRDFNYSDLKKLSLFGTEEKIPLFSELLALVGGRVPLLIEVKKQKRKGIEEKILYELNGYSGDYAVQAFDPFILKRFKRLAPQILRGRLSDYLCAEKNPVVRLVVRRMLFNFLAKPDFCNVNLKGVKKSLKIAKKLPALVWTVRTTADYKQAKAYGSNCVFEGLSPSELV